MRHARSSTNHVEGSRPAASILRRVGRAIGAVLALGLFAGGVSTLAAACGGTNAGSTGTTGGCDNGVETDAGACVAKCEPSKCIAGNTCVNNACNFRCSPPPMDMCIGLDQADCLSKPSLCKPKFGPSSCTPGPNPRCTRDMVYKSCERK